jgi:TP901 family phage tail tape measure protein
MSQVINRATRNGEDRMRAMADSASKYSQQGMGFLAAGAAGAALLAQPIRAYAQLEASSASLQSQMLEAGGVTSKYFQGLNELAIQLGNKLPGTTADMQGMFEMLLRNGTEAQDILNGVGKAAAYTGIALKMPYEAAAEFSAQLKIATGVASKDMEKFMDVIVRTRSLGVDPREMSYAFGRAGLKQFGIGGLDDAKAMSALFSTIIPVTKSGETAGSGLSRLITTLMNAEAMKGANAQLAQYGMNWEFVDKATGKFKGVENMVGQLGQLSKLNDSQRLNLLTSIFGSGEDTKIAAIIAANGVAGYNQAVNRMAAQGTLEQKVGIQANTASALWEAATGTITNALAAMGAAIAPEMKAVIGYISSGAAAMQQFAAQHPKMMKFIGLFTALVTGILMVVGVIKLMQSAMIVFNIISAANPLVLIFMAIAAAALLVYTYWDDISAFFTRIWNTFMAGAKALGLDKLFASIVGFVKKAFNFIWNIISNYTPIGLLIKNWDKVVKVFSAAWNIIKGHFDTVWNFISNLHKRFFSAGVNIVKSIISGITSMIDKTGEIMDKVAKKIRSYLPFSPAKAGPLRDIHRIKLIETVAATIKPAPLVNAIHGATSQALGAFNRPPALALSGNSGGGASVVVNYSPTINTNGAPGADFMAQLRQHKEEIARLVTDAMQRGARVKY